MKDRPLKDLLLRHFTAQRAFAQPEVDVYFASGIAGQPRMITDVDVFALLPRLESYGYDRILCDCRAKKDQSPIERALWLRGLMHLVDADSGYVLVDVERVEADHKLAASQMGITLLARGEFKAFDRARIYPAGSADVEISTADIERLTGVSKRFPRLEPLIDYAYRRAWQGRDFGWRIRGMIRSMHDASRELDPDRPDHVALVLDAAAGFAVAIAEAAGVIFHQYLRPDAKSVLVDALRVLLWGGRENYQFLKNVRNRMARSSTSENAELDLPDWDFFVSQLIPELLERPAAALIVPWILRRIALDVLRGKRPTSPVTKKDVIALKFAMLSTEYICSAGHLPRALVDQVVGILVRVQADLVDQAPPAASGAATCNQAEPDEVKDTATRDVGEQGGLFAQKPDSRGKP
jgi:hypothetical protein